MADTHESLPGFVLQYTYEQHFISAQQVSHRSDLTTRRGDFTRAAFHLGALIHLNLKAHTQRNAQFSACYLLAQGHSTTQSAGEADDLGHKRLEGEVFLEHDSPQNSLHLWNTGTCEGGYTGNCWGSVFHKKH